MNMIDEVIDEDDQSDDQMILDSVSSNLSMYDGAGVSEWKLVQDRTEKIKERKETINLKDITESDFLELIDMKNQDKRFFGWLNFKPLFQEFDPDMHGDPVMAHDLQHQEPKEFKWKQSGTDYTNIDEFMFDMFEVNMDD